ncbi:hypothetical protein IAD21_05059 [Abditibacteriota bacterium]|nr:hypothetical protein IAD21_05059 [Abditibacteriota bacterium]
MSDYTPRFANALVDKFGDKISAHIVRKLDIAFIQLEQSVQNSPLAENSRQVGAAVVYAIDRLYIHSVGHSAKIGFSFPPHDISFTFGQPVYTGTPRLLLRVPGLEAGESIAEHEDARWGKQAKLGYENSPLPTDSVLIFPNYEGPQENAKDRPIVQWSGVRPGEYVIIGGVKPEDEPEILKIITDEIGSPPEGQTVWQHYADVITVTGLSNILYSLRDHNWGNQYNTDLNYLKKALPAGNGSNDAGGLFIRDRDLEQCVSVFIPGSVRIGFNPSEQMSEDGGFAVLIEENGKQQIRPVSTHFMKNEYRYTSNSEPVQPQENQLRFIMTHPMRGFEAQLVSFLQSVEVINSECC